VTSTPVSAAQRAVELGRPVALLGLFLVGARAWGPWAAPLAAVTVFAFALLVHDLIHNALRLPKGLADVALAGFALFIIKSGHALRTSHVRHHQLCLDPQDEEGRVAHAPLLSLLVRGPWLALTARGTSFRQGGATRPWQVIETLLNLATLAALVIGALQGQVACALYLGAVIVVTVTAPIWGAKIPHTLPQGHPVVRWLKARVGRWTPAACSVLFHELHHRAPRLPVALLAAHQDELEARPPSPCEPGAP
jgi:fatty acid desaturase